MSAVRLTVLGCGNSAGVPSIGNYWGKCDPDEPRNRRLRPAAALRSDTTTILIDTGPDLREQVNRAGISMIDAVFFTHAHGDHIHGIDDLRAWRVRNKSIVDIWSNQATITELEDRFAYLFEDRGNGLYPRTLNSHVFDMGIPLTVGDITVTPYDQDHGTCRSVGFRCGDTAYTTDVVALNDQAIATLFGIRNWVVDAAGYKMPSNYVHMTLRELYAVNERVQAERIYLTHMTPGMDYRTLLDELPSGYTPAHDGLEIDILT